MAVVNSSVGWIAGREGVLAGGVDSGEKERLEIMNDDEDAIKYDDNNHE